MTRTHRYRVGLLSGRVHDLVIGTSMDLPKLRLLRMTDQQIVRIETLHLAELDILRAGVVRLADLERDLNDVAVVGDELGLAVLGDFEVLPSLGRRLF